MNVFEVVAQELTLVLSAVVLVFWIAYTLMLYNQHKHGTVRKDWKISMVFYTGIGLLVFGNLVLAASKLYESPDGEVASVFINLVSMVIFVFAFRMRMKHAVIQILETPKPAKKAGRR